MPQQGDLLNALGSPSPRPPQRPISSGRRKAPRFLVVAGLVLITLSILTGVVGLRGLFGAMFLLGWQCFILAALVAWANHNADKRSQPG